MKSGALNFEIDGRVVLLGIGNESKWDDAAGVEVVKEVAKMIDSEKVLFVNAGTIPEKFTSKVKDFEPDHILLIDTVDIDEEPGTVSIVDPEAIVNQKISTHRLPLSMLMEYLEKETGGEVFLIGIQPGKIKMGVGMSNSVRKAVEDLSEFLSEKLKRNIENC